MIGRWLNLFFKTFFWSSILFVVAIICFPTFFLTQYAQFFTLDNATKNADLILILSGNWTTRTHKAIQLRQANYAPKIATTFEAPMTSAFAHLFPTSDTICINIVLKNNQLSPVLLIPSSKNGATSTFDEAQDLVKYIKQNPNTKHIILVSDAFHTRRAYFAFKKVFKANGLMAIKLEIAAANNGRFNETNWWKSESGLVSYLLEPLKFVVYLFNSDNIASVKQD